MIDRACISLNNNCNLQCKYCHFQDKQIDFNSFDFKSLKIIVDNIHDYCKKNKLERFKLGIVGSGEPMLKSELIIELLKYVKENKYQEINIYTITNGTLLKKDLLKVFYKYKDFFKICISLDGYEEIHNSGRMCFSKVMEGIKNYFEIYKKMPAINSTVNYNSYLNKEKLISFYKDNNLFEVTFSKLIGYLEADLFISDEQYQDFMEYAFDSGINSRQFKSEKCYDCTMYGKLCGVGRTNIFIAPEGIYPCGRFYKNEKYNLGSYSDSLFKIDKEVHKLIPILDNKCYYIENVGVK